MTWTTKEYEVRRMIRDVYFKTNHFSKISYLLRKVEAELDVRTHNLKYKIWTHLISNSLDKFHGTYEFLTQNKY